MVLGGKPSEESGMFNITAKYDGTHRGICVQVFQDITFCQMCTLSNPSIKFQKKQRRNPGRYPGIYIEGFRTKLNADLLTK
jgi:hypothetical protein